MGSLVYFVFAVIDGFPFAPEPGAKDPDHTASVGEADGQHSSIDAPEAVVPSLLRAVIEVLGYDSLGIGERELRFRKRTPCFR
jgi:hypothetical protein